MVEYGDNGLDSRFDIIVWDGYGVIVDVIDSVIMAKVGRVLVLIK